MSPPQKYNGSIIIFNDVLTVYRILWHRCFISWPCIQISKTRLSICIMKYICGMLPSKDAARRETLGSVEVLEGLHQRNPKNVSGHYWEWTLHDQGHGYQWIPSAKRSKKQFFSQTYNKFSNNIFA